MTMESITPVGQYVGDSLLSVDILDAVTDHNSVKFTILTTTSMPKFVRTEFTVVRVHDDFIWLHDTLAENPDYAGFIIPPPPPRPEFEDSKEKLRKLGEAEVNLAKEDYIKTKQELEAEYLATFKKTVAMHETFLTRLANHPVFRNDTNLGIFLEYNQAMNVRSKSTKEKLAGFFSSFQKTSDELLLTSTLKDADEFFEKERHSLVLYHSNLKDCLDKAERMTSTHKSLAATYDRISVGLNELTSVGSKPKTSSPVQPEGDTKSGSVDAIGFVGDRESSASAPTSKSLQSFFGKTSDLLEKMRRIEGRVAADQDLKLSDLLRYQMLETEAAKNVLFRRLRCLANYESANKGLEKARFKNKDIVAAEIEQQASRQLFEKISQQAQDELKALKLRQVGSFQKSLSELAELELKHSWAHAQLLRASLASLRADKSNGY